jgi:tetratricopeptide (TPR) repeat protein
MKIDPSISATPFANVKNVSFYQREEEILFFMHSVFRIGSVKRIEKNDPLWQVDLTLTNDNDPQLQALTEHMQKETFSGKKGWDRPGVLLIKLGHSNKANQLYEIPLQKSTNEDETEYLYNMLGGIKNEQGEYAEAAHYSEKSITIQQKTLLQIILIWLLLTTTSEFCISRWASTGKHFHLLISTSPTLYTILVSLFYLFLYTFIKETKVSVLFYFRSKLD